MARYKHLPIYEQAMQLTVFIETVVHGFPQVWQPSLRLHRFKRRNHFMKKIPVVLLALLSLVGVASLALADSSRFLTAEPVSGEQVVTDSVTGLIWQKTYVTSKTWQQALAYCESLSYGGQSDWRLPNKKELMSLVNYERYRPASDFPNMPSNWFWSSSTYVGSTNYAWYVYFNDGDVNSNNKTNNYYARCVRGGP